MGAAEQLEADVSPYAISAEDVGLLHEMVAQVGAARDGGIPLGTARSDEWGFKWAVAFGRHTGTRWMRPRLTDAALNPTVEAWYHALKLFWMQQHMQPGAKRAKRGISQALPSSALLATHAHRRVLKDCGRYVGDLALSRDVLRGMCEQYKVIWGPEAFEVDQAAIFSRDAQ